MPTEKQRSESKTSEESTLDSTEMATREAPGALAPTDLDGFDASDFIIPRLKLVQKGSDKELDLGGKVGEFFSTLTNTSRKEVPIVPLGIGKGRVEFEKGQRRPVCRSDDAKFPSSSVENPPARTCAKCARSRWTTDAYGKRVPPPCSLTYNLLAEDLDEQIPFMATMKRKSGVSAARKLNTIIHARGRGVASRIQCVMTSWTDENDFGKFECYDFHSFALNEHPDKYATMATEYKAHAASGKVESEGGADDDLPF